MKQAVKISEELLLNNLKEVVFCNFSEGFKFYWKMFKPQWAKRNKKKIRILKKSKKKNPSLASISKEDDINKIIELMYEVNDEKEYKSRITKQDIGSFVSNYYHNKFVKEYFFEFKHEQQQNLKENFIVWKLNYSLHKEENKNKNYLTPPLPSTKMNSQKYFLT